MARIDRAEKFFAALGATIRHGGNRAFYSIAADVIQMPPFESFQDADSYYATLAHECTHWAGSKTRLDRDFGGHRFGSEGYAVEELVAEMLFLTGWSSFQSVRSSQVRGSHKL
ncbi:MAG: zincin-like metallopeptidase domain-containing protein [Bdellovibrionota bacterium]